jgi:hypothetical protein
MHAFRPDFFVFVPNGLQVLSSGFLPRLSSHLDRIPRAGEWRGIAQVEVIQFLDLHPVVEGCGKNIYTFRDFGIHVAQHCAPGSRPVLRSPVMRKRSSCAPG